MKKSIFVSVGAAAIGVVAGGLLLGATNSVSAVSQDGTGLGEGQGFKGVMSETMNNVLDITQEDLDGDTCRKDLILDEYESVEAFREEVNAQLVEDGFDVSQRKAQMLLDGEGPHGNENGARTGR